MADCRRQCGCCPQMWLLPADVDIDGVVNYFDFAIFASAWDSMLGEPDYNPVCDFVVDDVIDVNDLPVLSENWLRRITIADFTKDGRVASARWKIISSRFPRWYCRYVASAPRTMALIR